MVCAPAWRVHPQTFDITRLFSPMGSWRSHLEFSPLHVRITASKQVPELACALPFLVCWLQVAAARPGSASPPHFITATSSARRTLGSGSRHGSATVRTVARGGRLVQWPQTQAQQPGRRHIKNGPVAAR